MRPYLLILLLLFLMIPVPAHEGEEHADIREATQHAEAEAALTVNQTVQLEGETYAVSFRQLPASPEFGQEIQVEVRVEGASAQPLLGRTVTAKLLGPADSELGEAHIEPQPGWYGVHFTPETPGAYRIEFLFSGDPELLVGYGLQVPRPLPRRVAGYAAMGILVLLVLGSIVYAVRGGRDIKQLGPVWLLGLLAAGGLGVWAYWLVPTAEAASSSPDARTQTVGVDGVVVPPEIQDLLGMKMAPAELTTVNRSITVPGLLSVPDGAMHAVQAPFTAKILSSTIPQVGEIVRAGDPLLEVVEVLTSGDQVALRGQRVELDAARIDFETARLQSRQQLADLKASLREAQSRLAQRRQELVRAEGLYEIEVIALKELEAARFAVEQANLELQGLENQVAVWKQGPPVPEQPPVVGPQRQTISAPIGGRIASVHASPGETVGPTVDLFTVINLSRMWVRARVPEGDLGQVRDAGGALVSTTAFPGPFPARLVSFGPVIDPETRTATVLFELTGVVDQLLHGMAAEVEIQGLSKQALTVPRDAILESEGEERVFVKVAEDRFQARTVKVGEILKNRAVLSSGLEAGTLVVVEGAGALASELARREGR